MRDNGPKRPSQPAIPDLEWGDIYKVWAYECDQSDRKTAAATGIAQRTIAYHRIHEGWGDRYVEAHYGISETDLNLAKLEVRALAKEGLQRRLRSIILDEVPVLDPFTGELERDADGAVVMRWRSSDKDAVAAMRIVAEYALDPARHSDISGALPAQFTVRSHGTQAMSPEDMAIAILEENASLTNTRVRKGRRT